MFLLPAFTENPKNTANKSIDATIYHFSSSDEESLTDSSTTQTEPVKMAEPVKRQTSDDISGLTLNMLLDNVQYIWKF